MAAVEPDPTADLRARQAAAINERDHPPERWSLTDIVRAATGVAIAALGVALAALATDTLGGMQADLARAVGRLPGPARTASIGLAQVAAVVAPAVLVVAAAAQRRGRMLVAIVLAGAAAVALTSLPAPITPLLFAGSVVATTDPAKRTRVVSEPSRSPRRCHPGPSPST